jgi:Arginine kinase
MNLPPFLLEHPLWGNEANPIWPASSFILHRNLSTFHFPNKENETELAQTLKQLQQAVCKGDALCLEAQQLTPTEREFMVEHFLRFDNFQHTLAGQAFVIDPTTSFLATLNIDDHLQLQLIDCKGEWEKSFATLATLEKQLSGTLPFAFSPTFGYLTADPLICGTGLTVDAYLHLPALIHTKGLEEALRKEKDSDVVAFGMKGTLEELVGDIVILRNRYTLGVSEENILLPLNTSAMKCVVAEKTVRNELQKGNNIEIKDHISRAFGLLSHSYQLQTKEALDALSLIKLGIDLGWITGVTDQKLNALFFNCRRAHLKLLTGKETEEVSKLRAEFLHKELAGMKLVSGKLNE